MKPLDWLVLALTVLESVLVQAVKSKAPQEQIERLQAAIANLQAVRGSDVTWAQLEGFRIQMTWLDQET